MTSSARRDVRVQVRLPVTADFGGIRQLETADISYRGLFVVTEAPPTERAFVRVVVHVPGRDADGTTIPIPLTGMAVRVVPPGGTREAGVGVELFAVAEDVKAAWMRLVSHYAHAETKAPPPRIVRVVEDRREHARWKVGMLVQFLDHADLVNAYTRDLSMGGLFVVVDKPLNKDERVILEIRAPGQKEGFRVEAVVRRQTPEGARWGAGLEVVGDKDAFRRAVWNYIAPEAANDRPRTLTDFEIEVVIDGIQGAVGHGKSKREAEQAAAEAVLRRDGIWSEK